MEKRKAVSSHAEAEANRRAYLDAYQALACLLVFCCHSALNPQARQDRLGRVQRCPLVLCPEWLFARRQVAGEAQCRRRLVDDFVYLTHRFLRIYPASFAAVWRSEGEVS